MPGGARTPRNGCRNVLLLLLSGALGSTTALPAAEVGCAALAPPPEGDEIIQLGPEDAAALPGIAAAVGPGTTILLQDGVYAIGSSIAFNSPNVTLRSLSGDRDAVVLDAGYDPGAAELIRIDTSGITIADLTLERVWHHPVHVVGGGHFATLYNLRIVDGRQQFVKVNQEGGDYADFGLAACNELELTAAGRSFIEENPTAPYLCYTGGFDLHRTWGWLIRDNRIRGIHCTNGGLAEHAIHFFQSNREPVVERNLILDSARGIGFGLGPGGFLREFPDDPFAGTEMEGREDEVMQIGGVIQNNIIQADIGEFYDSGINLESAWRPVVRHNTIYSADGSFNSAIDVRFSGSVSVVLDNNLYYPRMTVRNGAPQPARQGNVLAGEEMFVSLTAGDLHLVESATAAIDMGVELGLADDFDGQPRDGLPDVGADEWLDANTAPTVRIDQPPDGGAFSDSQVIDFSGTATDLEDGSLSSGLLWSSDIAGPLGTGAEIGVTLGAGLHRVQAWASDSGGLSGSDEIDIGVTAPDCPAETALGGEVVHETRTDSAVYSITAGPELTVAAGGDLTLRTAGTVALGEDLSVLGALAVIIEASPCG